MKNAKHTQAPWVVEKGSIYTVEKKSTVCGYQPQLIAQPEHAPDYMGESHREANAARIVACVNALEGLNPEALQEFVIAATKAVELLREYAPDSPSTKRAFTALAELERKRS